MIIFLFFLFFCLILNSFLTHRLKPMALVICLELLALITFLAWLFMLKSGLTTDLFTISFLLMFFIILGATLGLVLLSILSSYDAHRIKINMLPPAGSVCYLPQKPMDNHLDLMVSFVSGVEHCV